MDVKDEWGPTRFSVDRRRKGIQTNALHWRWNWTKRHCHHGLENVSRSSGSTYRYDRTNVHCPHCLTKEQPLPTPTTSWSLAIRTPAAYVVCHMGHVKLLVDMRIHQYLPEWDWVAESWSTSHATVYTDRDPPQPMLPWGASPSEPRPHVHRTRIFPVAHRISCAQGQFPIDCNSYWNCIMFTGYVAFRHRDAYPRITLTCWEDGTDGRIL